MWRISFTIQTYINSPAFHLKYINIYIFTSTLSFLKYTNIYKCTSISFPSKIYKYVYFYQHAVSSLKYTNIYKFTSISFKTYKYIYFYQHDISRSTMQGFCEEYHSHTSSTFANIFVENKAFKPSSLANRFLQKSKHSQQAVSRSTLQWFCEEYHSHTRSTFVEIFEENKAFKCFSLERNKRIHIMQSPDQNPSLGFYVHKAYAEPYSTGIIGLNE